MANKLKNTLPFYCLMLIFSVSIIACNTTERGPCLEPTVPKLQLGCYQLKGVSFVDTALPNANIVSLDIDSAMFWYWGAKGQNKFQLLLSPLHDTARWIVQTDSFFAPIDTLTFIYERELKFYSNACGYGYNFKLRDLLFTTRNLDSVSISTNEVTTKAGIENVKIYF